jgi:diguanylate cyclase (GGDEF)-like protein/PAS domain S-box-containing protein
VIHDLDREIEARKRAEKSNRASEARFRCVVDSNLIGIVFLNLSGVILEANDAFLKLVGYTREELERGDLSWHAITPKEDRLQEAEALKALKSAPVEKEYVRKDGSRVPVLFRAAPIPGSAEELACFLLDLSGQKQTQEKVDYIAYHDALTSLPNQTLFKDRLEQALVLTRPHGQLLAVMLVNLDRFKVINETLGYPTGDRVLQEVALRLTNCVREGDTVARFGSDEFALLLTQVNRSEDAANVAQSIKEALDLPFNFLNQELFTTGSIGISLHPYDGKDSLTLLKSAGTALCRAKEQNGNNYQFYTAGQTTKALKRLVLENNLRCGLEREEFVVHYQPQVNVATAQLVGMEALVRWQHPGLGLLYPGEFIALAEESGLIVSIGEWVMRTACKQSKSWQDAGFDPLRIGVNLSARHFQQPQFVDTVGQILGDTGLDPHCLELELTERSIMKEPEQVIGKLHELKQMGLHISIDDFGTGYSSLNYLKRFPIDTLKIDQSFVQEISTDTEGAAIVTAIITLGHALRLNVIAEGVETEEQLEYLRSLNCDEVQGFLFSKPLTADDFTQLLMEKRRLTSRGDYSTSRLPALPAQVIG